MSLVFTLRGRSRQDVAELVAAIGAATGCALRGSTTLGVPGAGEDRDPAAANALEFPWWVDRWELSRGQEAEGSFAAPGSPMRTDAGLRLEVPEEGALRFSGPLEDEWAVFELVLGSGRFPFGVTERVGTVSGSPLSAHTWGFTDGLPVPADLFGADGVDPNLRFWWPILHLSPEVLDLIGTPAEAGLETIETVDFSSRSDQHGLAVLRTLDWPAEDPEVVRAWSDYLTPAIGVGSEPTDVVRSFVEPWGLHPCDYRFTLLLGRDRTEQVGFFGAGRFSEDFEHPDLPPFGEHFRGVITPESLRVSLARDLAPPLDWTVGERFGTDEAIGNREFLSSSEMLLAFADASVPDWFLESRIGDLNGRPLATGLIQREPVPVMTAADTRVTPASVQPSHEREEGDALTAPPWAFPHLKWVQSPDDDAGPGWLLLRLDRLTKVGPVAVVLGDKPRVRKRRVIALRDLFDKTREAFEAGGVELGPTPVPEDWENEAVAVWDLIQWLRLRPPPPEGTRLDAQVRARIELEARLGADSSLPCSPQDDAMELMHAAAQRRRDAIVAAKAELGLS
ncbi:MAG: hypothetical protein ACRBI6_16600 [Acidimicrobiales bacterium]